MFRDDLPDDAGNENVYCERCRRVHRKFTFTRQDYDRYVAEAAKRLQENIDGEALAFALNALH